MANKIKEIQVGSSDQIYLMVRAISEKETRKGGSYLVLDVTDGEKVIPAKIWDTKKTDVKFQIGDIVFVTLSVMEYNEKPDYVISRYSLAAEGEADKASFLHYSPISPQRMYDEILKVVQQMPNREVADIVNAVFTDKKEQLLSWTAARKIHHTGIGELLYHSYCMMRAGIADCKIYREADASFVVAGCILHDIGKLEELEIDALGNTTLTIDGALFGHAYLGCRIVEEYGRKTGASKETIRQLTHIIASHHGKKEWGAIAVPSTMEAYIVHQCDLRDTKIYIFESAYKELEPGSMTDDSNFFLEQAHIYHPIR